MEKRTRKKYIPALRFNTLTPVYDITMKYFMPETRFKTALISQAFIRDNFEVLDFGCGTATLTIMAKTQIPKAKITGIDIDENIAQIAKDKIKYGNLDIKIDTYDGDALPYKKETFDRIITSLVIHHIPKDKKQDIFKELHRVLKSGGELHAADFGKPKTIYAKIISSILQLFEPIKDNVAGRIPEQLEAAGFVGAKETAYFNTIFGTLTIYSAKKA